MRWYLQGAAMRHLDELFIQLLMGMGIALSMVVLVMSALF
jgi:hypothetical protein